MIEEIRAQTRLDHRLYDAVVDHFDTAVDATDVCWMLKILKKQRVENSLELVINKSTLLFFDMN